MLKICLKLIFFWILGVPLFAQQMIKENGVEMWYRRSPSPRTSLEVIIRGGQSLAPVRKDGLESLLLDLVFLYGPTGFDSLSFSRYLDSLDIQLSWDVQPDYGRVRMNMPVSSTEEGLKLLTNCFLHPKLENNKLSQLVQARIHTLDHGEVSAEQRANQVSRSLLFRQGPQGNALYGTTQTLNQISIQDLKSFYKNQYVKSAFLVSVVTSEDLSWTKQKVVGTLGQLPLGLFQGIPQAPLQPLEKTAFQSVKDSGSNSILIGMARIPSLSTQEGVSAMLAASWLEHQVRKELIYNRNLAVEVKCGVSFMKSPYFFFQIMGPDLKVARMVLKEIWNIQQPPDSIAFQQYRELFLTVWFSGMHTGDALAHFTAEQSWIWEGMNDVQWRNHLRSVRPQDIQAVSQKWLTRLQWVYIGVPGQVSEADIQF